MNFSAINPGEILAHWTPPEVVLGDYVGTYHMFY